MTKKTKIGIVIMSVIAAGVIGTGCVIYSKKKAKASKGFENKTISRKATFYMARNDNNATCFKYADENIKFVKCELLLTTDNIKYIHVLPITDDDTGSHIAVTETSTIGYWGLYPTITEAIFATDKWLYRKAQSVLA